MMKRKNLKGITRGCLGSYNGSDQNQNFIRIKQMTSYTPQGLISAQILLSTVSSDHHTKKEILYELQTT